MQILVDLIIPVYNVSPFLRECLDSVVQQTFKDFRVIIVDDGSTDDSGQICEEYVKAYSYMTVIHQQNMGLSGAKNTGLRHSTAPYVIFLDSDDWMSPEALESLYEIATAHNSDIVQCKTVLEYHKTRERPFDIKTCKAIDMEVEDVYKSIFSVNDVGPASWGKIYKRKIVEDLVFPVGKVHEDVAVLERLLSRVTKFTYFDAPLWHYRYREDSISRTHYAPKNKYLFDCIVGMENVIKKYPSLISYYQGYKLLMVKSLLIMFTEEDVVNNRGDYELFKNIITENRWNMIFNHTISFTNKLSILLATSKLHSIIKHIFK